MKFRRSNSGIFYLIFIGLAAAIAAGAFRMDGGILLVPVLMVAGCIIVAMIVRHLKKSK